MLETLLIYRSQLGMISILSINNIHSLNLTTVHMQQDYKSQYLYTILKTWFGLLFNPGLPDVENEKCVST